MMAKVPFPMASTGPTFSKHDVPWQTNVHRTNLFVFTILREPLLHAISYYNFFHKHQVNDATENMLKEHVWLPINSVPPCLTTRKDGGSHHTWCHGCKNLCKIVQEFTTTF
jgi:hypothetical protein